LSIEAECFAFKTSIIWIQDFEVGCARSKREEKVENRDPTKKESVASLHSASLETALLQEGELKEEEGGADLPLEEAAAVTRTIAGGITKILKRSKVRGRLAQLHGLTRSARLQKCQPACIASRSLA